MRRLFVILCACALLLSFGCRQQSVSSAVDYCCDTVVTLRAYADAMPARDQEAAATMDRLLLATGSVVPAAPADDPAADPPAAPDP